jgi:hypothetical protein
MKNVLPRSTGGWMKPEASLDGLGHLPQIRRRLLGG